MNPQAFAELTKDHTQDAENSASGSVEWRASPAMPSCDCFPPA